MNQSIQHKIDQYKKIAKNQQTEHVVGLHLKTIRSTDGLSKVIRNQEDAAIFMADLQTAIKQGS